jgi:hypothetical protein
MAYGVIAKNNVGQAQDRNAGARQEARTGQEKGECFQELPKAPHRTGSTMIFEYLSCRKRSAGRLPISVPLVRAILKEPTASRRYDDTAMLMAYL